jgi:hypothetical protein
MPFADDVNLDIEKAASEFISYTVVFIQHCFILKKNNNSKRDKSSDNKYIKFIYIYHRHGENTHTGLEKS